jgi:hypothetical protein
VSAAARRETLLRALFSGACRELGGAALALEDAVRVQQPRAKHQLAWRDT